MPPDVNENIPNDDEGSAQQHTPWTAFIFPTIIILLVFLFVSSYLYVTQYAANSSPEPEAIVEEKGETTNTEDATAAPKEERPATNELRSRIANVRFVVPDGWVRVPRESADFPDGVIDPSIVLHDPIEGCYIAVSDFDREAAAYTQTTIAKRVESERFRFQGDWYVDESEFSEPIEYAEERQFHEGELRVANNFDTEAFILWQEAGEAVPSTCNDALNAILATTDYYFEEITLDTDSFGVLNIRRLYDNEHNSSDTIILTFTEEVTGETYQVMELPRGAHWYERIDVYRNSLYLPVTMSAEGDAAGRFEGGVAALDPFAKTTSFVPGTIFNDNYLSSLYLTGKGNAYYLLGESDLGYCLDGYQTCTADLYKADLHASNTPELLYQDVLGRRILGVENDTNEVVYLFDGNGDGGCLSYQMSQFASNTEEIVAEVFGCVDDPGFEEELASFNELRARFSATSSRGLYVSYGGLSAYPSDDATSSASGPRFRIVE